MQLIADLARKAARTTPVPIRKWIADFTNVWTAEGWLYVAPSLICSRGGYLPNPNLTFVEYIPGR